MAARNDAGGGSSIRVRLLFDYPPPAVVDSRMCWLLVDLNACRVVADLESIIRERFEFGRGSVLSLYIEDCYLPHTESVHVVRDNDSVRVKVHCLAQMNGHSSSPHTSSKKCRKRRRPTEDDEPGEHGVSVEWEGKKRKKRSEKGESLEEQAKQSQGKHTEEEEEEKKKKKKRKKKKILETVPAAIPFSKPAASSTKLPTVTEHPVKSTKKPTAKRAKAQESSSSDSDSSLEIAPKSKTLTSPSPKGRTKGNSESQAAPSALQSTNCIQKRAANTAVPPQNKAVEPCNSDSEEESELVGRLLTLQPGAGVGRQASGRGCSRGKSWCGSPGEEGSGKGRVLKLNGSKFSNNEAKEPSYHSDSLTNISVVLQNEAKTTPKQDYSSMPLLAAPPQVGQKIAFKLLELTENYTPEVSEYKEGKIVSFDPTTKQIELELLHVCQAPAEPGKFDLVYQNPDGSESVEYAVSRSAWVTERWDSLLEPRLIL